ncbi:Tfp pilus assembly protein FimT/FimU [Deinococcus yunweiensis]|uniref:pilus assembly FimT family protein n=1 Tax=Deinococcus yunweiensis TaxID=367282 RepID=UPI00398EBE6A
MRTSGYSLLEALVVLAILGVLAGLGISGYLAWTQSMRVHAAVSEIQRVFTKARARARTSNHDVYVTLDTATRTFTLYQGSDPTTPTWTVAMPVEASAVSLACRTPCPALASGGPYVTLLAPYGALKQDLKLNVAVSARSRTVYLLGPTALLKTVAP